MKTAMNRFKRFYIDNGAVVYLIVIALLASIFVPSFFSINNFQNLLKQWAVPAIVCAGMAFLVITGGIDLSMGYVLALSSVTAGVLIKFHEFNPYLAFCMGIATGAAFGCVNGFIISVLKVPPFITTLGSGYIAYGLAQIISGGRSANKLGDAFMGIGNTKIIGTTPSMVFVALAVVLLAWFMMNRTTYGRNLQYMGYNTKTARLSGVRVDRIIFISYMVSGALAGLAGMFLTMRTGVADPTLGGGSTPFDAVTACVLGGSLLSGGFAPIIGSSIGVLILKIIENCINLLNLKTYIYDVVRALIIFAAIVADSYKRQHLHK